MKFSLLSLALLVMISSCSKNEKSAGSSSGQKRIQQIVQERETKELEIIQEKSRDDKYSILMDSQMGMGSKITASQDIISSMNDVIDRKGVDNEHNKEILAEEFSLRMQDVYSQINFKKMDPLKVRGHHESSFYAMAASLDGSFYELMKNALKKDSKNKILKNSEGPIVTQDSKEMMIDLIKARVDILSVFALQNLTDKNKMSFWQKTKSFAFSLSGGIIGNIEYPETYQKANDATKNKIEDHLGKAVEAKVFLSVIGIDKKLTKKMRSAYKGIDFDEKKKTDANNKDALAVDQRKEVIRSHINGLLN